VISLLHHEGQCSLCPRSGAVTGPLYLVDAILLAIALMGEGLSARRVFPQHRPLPAIGLSAPHPRLLAVRQVRQHRGIRRVRRRRHHRVNQLAPAAHPSSAVSLLQDFLPLQEIVAAHKSAPKTNLFNSLA
jgi:hypothetical protein